MRITRMNKKKIKFDKPMPKMMIKYNRIELPKQLKVADMF